VSLNIKNEETCRLVQELAQLTGESLTAAVTTAVKEKLAKERSKVARKPGLAKRLMEIGRETAPLIPEPWRSVDHGELLYDEMGLPK
jgi:antitoxin VapB